jgi:hypothetical protein
MGKRKLAKESDMNENAGRTRAWLWLTIPIAILAAIAAGSGLLVAGLYRASPSFVVGQAVGQDLVTLAVALPTLIISAVLAGRGSQRARLIWLGVLIYFACNYAFTSFTVRFNALFLVYVALLGCSTYALIGGLATTNLAGIKARFTEKTPVKAVSIFLAVMLVLFYFVWLVDIVPATIAGDVPRMVSWNETPTSAFYVLDMAWILPAVGLAAAWLWRKRAVGYALAGVLLTTLFVEELAVMSEMVSGARYGHPVAIFPEITVYITASVVTLGILIWFLRGLRES